jgi:hypothetical protein
MGYLARARRIRTCHEVAAEQGGAEPTDQITPSARRQARELIQRLDEHGLIPAPWDLMTFVNLVARWRGRAIKICGRDGDYWATGADGDYLSGLCIRLDNIDVILYRTDGGSSTAHHIIAHELAHLLADHTQPAGLTESVESAAEPVSYSDVLRLSCARSRFDDPDERVAEAFADLLLTSVSRRGTPLQQRLAQILGRRDI